MRSATRRESVTSPPKTIRLKGGGLSGSGLTGEPLAGPQAASSRLANAASCGFIEEPGDLPMEVAADLRRSLQQRFRSFPDGVDGIGLVLAGNQHMRVAASAEDPGQQCYAGGTERFDIHRGGDAGAVKNHRPARGGGGWGGPGAHGPPGEVGNARTRRV